MVKGLVVGDHIISTDAISGMSISKSSLTSMYQCIIKQGHNWEVLLASQNKDDVQKFYDKLSAVLFEKVDIASMVDEIITRTVKIYDGSSLLKTETVKDTNSWTIPTLAKEGHTLEGVYLNQDLTKKVGPTIAINSDLNLYTKWNINKHKVTFNVDGGSAIPQQTVNWGGKATKPAKDPTKDGHTFGGYFKDANKNTSFNFETELIKSNTTVYVKWTATSPAPSLTLDEDTASES